VFDPEGDPMWPIRGSKFWRKPTLSLRKGFPRMLATVMVGENGNIPIQTECDPEISLGGIFQARGGEVRITIDDDGMHADDDMLTSPSWLINRAAVIVDPWWDAYFARRWQTDPERTTRLIHHEINECRGALRWLVTALASINALPRDVRPVNVRTGRRAVGMHMLPYLGHSHLRIELPRDNRIVYARKQLDHQTHSTSRRYHDVIGHWRVVERGKKMTYFCRHMPTMVENGLGICENCEMLIRWIPAHTRGDPNLGRVEHTEYEVTA